jgi:hypothetical protein
MRISEVIKLSPLDRFGYFVKERESIRIKRSLKIDPPWTDDEILQKYRFCNVRRMDDKVSQWLFKNWYKPFKDHPNMILAATLARMLNNPESLAAIGFPVVWEPEQVDKILHGRAKAGLKNFSAAYMITGTLGGTKVHQIVWKVADELQKSPPIITGDSMKDAVESLIPYNGFSYFMAGQVVADLRWAMTGTWRDKKCWAPVGPGSRRGMNRLLGRPIGQAISDEEFTEQLQELMTACEHQLPNDTTKRMEAIDWQSCLCETDKHTRALLGEGRPKQLYTWKE